MGELGQRFSSSHGGGDKAGPYARIPYGAGIFAFVEKGEEMETHLLREWVDRWMVGIVSLAWIVNPDRIVIGGGISAQRNAPHALSQGGL